MKTSNEVAVELQAKFDYFFAGAILASFGFAVQMAVDNTKCIFLLHSASLIFFSVSALSCFYRLQQKPLIYELLSKAESAVKQRNNDLNQAALIKANRLESRYITAYTIMCLFFGLGAISVALVKLLPMYFLLFSY